VIRSYHTIDKSAWPDGPWEKEPDKIQWTDEATGLPCLAKRHDRMGFLCGYVGIPPEHPLFGVPYEQVVGIEEPHGGLTYSDRCQDGPEDKAVCHIPEPGEPDDVWWLGFDCGHFMDYLPGMETLLGEDPLGGTYKTISYVQKECSHLAAQLAAIE
jgi:hypothetical protein